jgi:hypothetical protein
MLLECCLDAENVSALALDEKGDCRGVFPMFLKRNERYGNVINSLPFFGSNGGIVAKCGEATNALMEYFLGYLNDSEAVAYTIVSSPFDSEKKQAFYRSKLSRPKISERLGVLTQLVENGDDLETKLLTSYHQKTRNIVRKAKRSELCVEIKNDEIGFDFLEATHTANMQALGVLAKPPRFFSFVKDKLLAGTDYNLYVAYYKDTPISGLLLFYYNGVVEYYCPVNVAEYRNLQALSLLIHEAMKAAVMNGLKWWNWGGVSAAQRTVYDFKRKWGTIEKPYFYYTGVLEEDIMRVNNATILEEFKYFFVYPFQPSI